MNRIKKKRSDRRITEVGLQEIERRLRKCLESPFDETVRGDGGSDLGNAAGVRAAGSADERVPDGTKDEG